MAPAPSPRPHVKAVLFGTLYNAQTWSVGINIDYLALPTSPNLATYAEALWTAAKNAAAFKACMAFASPGCSARGVKAYYFPANATRPTGLGVSTSAAIVGTGTVADLKPPQSALVATLLSATLGRHSTGRSYLPLQCASMSDASGNVQNSVPPAVATGWANTLVAWNGVSLGGQPGVCSVYSTSTGVMYPITSVRVDSVYDTVRARRDKIVALTVSSATVIAP